MPDAIALGELLIDFVSLDRDAPLATLPRFAGAAGGAPANVAVGLARQGVSAGFVGKVGDDPFGDFLRHTLAGDEVDTQFLAAAPGVRTTLAFVATRADGRKDICFYRNPGADMMLAPEEVSRDYLSTARLFHFGSVSLSRGPARDATLQAARLARELGLLVSFDPNWRPTLWDGYREARHWIWEAMPQADIVHCAEEEWEFITGTDSLEAGARKILDAGPAQLVVVTCGERGCYYDTGRHRGHAPGFAVEVVDPLGAGDAFVAALLARLLEVGDPAALSPAQLDEMAAYANAAGAITCTQLGVIPALPRAAAVEEFLRVKAGR